MYTEMYHTPQSHSRTPDTSRSRTPYVTPTTLASTLESIHPMSPPRHAHVPRVPHGTPTTLTYTLSTPRYSHETRTNPGHPTSPPRHSQGPDLPTSPFTTHVHTPDTPRNPHDSPQRLTRTPDTPRYTHDTHTHPGHPTSPP